MTEQHARVTANTVMAAAAIGAAVIVMRSPSLRRMVGGLVKASAAPLTVYALRTVHDAWDASATLDTRAV